MAATPRAWHMGQKLVALVKLDGVVSNVIIPCALAAIARRTLDFGPPLGACACFWKLNEVSVTIVCESIDINFTMLFLIHVLALQFADE